MRSVTGVWQYVSVRVPGSQVDSSFKQGQGCQSGPFLATLTTHHFAPPVQKQHHHPPAPGRTKETERKRQRISADWSHERCGGQHGAASGQQTVDQAPHDLHATGTAHLPLSNKALDASNFSPPMYSLRPMAPTTPQEYKVGKNQSTALAFAHCLPLGPPHLFGPAAGPLFNSKVDSDLCQT